MNIADVICAAGRAGFFNRDLAAVKAGAKADGFAYPGRPVSPGFTRIVQPGTAISVMLVLEDGQVAFGDCMDVILSGVAGRDPLFRAEDHLGFMRTVIRDRLCGRPIDRFRPHVAAWGGSHITPNGTIAADGTLHPAGHLTTRRSAGCARSDGGSVHGCKSVGRDTVGAGIELAASGQGGDFLTDSLGGQCGIEAL